MTVEEMIFIFRVAAIKNNFKDRIMKIQDLSVLVIFAMTLYSCSGNRADGKDGVKDTSYKYTDTSKHNPKDTIGKDAYQDSTSNAPRMPSR